MRSKFIMRFPSDKAHRSLLVNLAIGETPDEGNLITFVEKNYAQPLLLGIISPNELLYVLASTLMLGVGHYTNSNTEPVEGELRTLTLEVEDNDLKITVNTTVYYHHFVSLEKINEYLSDAYGRILNRNITTTKKGKKESVFTELLTFDNGLMIDFLNHAGEWSGVRFWNKRINKIIGIVKHEMLIWFIIRFLNQRHVQYRFPHVATNTTSFEATMFMEGKVLYLTVDGETYIKTYNSEEDMFAQLRELNKQILHVSK